MMLDLHGMRQRLGNGANRDRKLRLIRAASTAATGKHGIGGRPKIIGGPRPITLPKLKCLEGPTSGEVDER